MCVLLLIVFTWHNIALDDAGKRADERMQSGDPVGGLVSGGAEGCGIGLAAFVACVLILIVFASIGAFGGPINGLGGG